ncbi:MAG: hypothetical protein LBS46_09245 [Dysgonamonadaceae bacterium]|nr:hypothetical protein [Dysgonamonadaceae bacterium]
MAHAQSGYPVLFGDDMSEATKEAYEQLRAKDENASEKEKPELYESLNNAKEKLQNLDQIIAEKTQLLTEHFGANGQTVGFYGSTHLDSIYQSYEKVWDDFALFFYYDKQVQSLSYKIKYSGCFFEQNYGIHLPVDSV